MKIYARNIYGGTDPTGFIIDVDGGDDVNLLYIISDYAKRYIEEHSGKNYCEGSDVDRATKFYEAIIILKAGEVREI